MARANFVKAARKDYPEQGIKKGESYYWWQFRYGPKRMSKTPPKPSQLTQSEFLQTYYGFQEELAAMEAESMDDLQSQIEDLAQRMRDLAEECREKQNNMPDALQQSDTGVMLEERADGLDSWADELDNLNYDFDPEELSQELSADDLAEALNSRIAELIDEANAADPGL